MTTASLLRDRPNLLFPTRLGIHFSVNQTYTRSLQNDRIKGCVFVQKKSGTAKEFRPKKYIKLYLLCIDNSNSSHINDLVYIKSRMQHMNRFGQTHQDRTDRFQPAHTLGKFVSDITGVEIREYHYVC